MRQKDCASIYVFMGGAVTEIKAPAEPEPDDSAAVAQENETLKAQLKEAQDALASVKSDLEAFKAQITSDIKGFKSEPPPGGEGGEAIRKPFKSSK